MATMPMNMPMNISGNTNGSAQSVVQYASAPDLMYDLIRDAFVARVPIVIGVEDFEEYTLVELRDMIRESTLPIEHLVVPFADRVATMDFMLAELAERLRLAKKYSLAGAASLPVPDAIRELFEPRDQRVIMVIQHADRMPIEMFRHLAGAMSRVNEENEPGALFVLGVGEGFFDTTRGEIMLQALRPHRITSNEILTQQDDRKGIRKRVVPHPTDEIFVSPNSVGVDDVDPVVTEVIVEDDNESIYSLLEDAEDVVEINSASSRLDEIELGDRSFAPAGSIVPKRKSFLKRLTSRNRTSRFEPDLADDSEAG